MGNMTIENIGSYIQSGNVEKLQDRMQVAGEVNQPGEGKSFSEMIHESLEQVNQDQLQADRAAKELVAGRNKNIHETMLLLEKADVSFRMMTQVRNKVIEAYREIMRMQV